MKKQISEQRWDTVKSKRRSSGTTQPTELYTNGREPPVTKKDQSPDQLHGLTLEIGAAKWCKEHVSRKGNDLTDEGLLLLENMELWWQKQT